MILEGGVAGDLETRRAFDGSTIVSGAFPYDAVAQFPGGRSETFALGAFGDSIRSHEGEVNFLYGHDYNRPLASRGAGTLHLSDSGGAVSFEAKISAKLMDISFVRDAVAAIENGLVLGLSPGFRVAAKDQTVTRNADGVLRTIRKAQLFELSAVSRAAYPDAQLEARNWTPDPAKSVQSHASARWR